MKKLDKETRDAIAFQVGDVVFDVLAGLNEKWLSEEQTLEQFSFLTKNFLDRYGHLLGKKQITVWEENGTSHKSRWGYPMHRINKMMMDGSISKLQNY